MCRRPDKRDLVEAPFDRYKLVAIFEASLFERTFPEKVFSQLNWKDIEVLYHDMMYLAILKYVYKEADAWEEVGLP